MKEAKKITENEGKKIVEQKLKEAKKLIENETLMNW
jgi:hypothetical protein